jgi:murein DD-endopeptidase MepM/ murein hydrolase activator NlpD
MAMSRRLSTSLFIAGLIAAILVVGAIFGRIGRLTDPPDFNARPAFQMPFACGENWRLSTYKGHNPEDKKLDYFRQGGPTEGGTVVASAAGEVRRLVRPGGVKLYHGKGWYTLYLHMDGIRVEPGQQVAAGQPIGSVGAVGTRVAHLHYEQLFDSDADGDAPPPEIVHPVIQGKEYSLDADNPFPTVTSTNACPAS